MSRRQQPPLLVEASYQRRTDRTPGELLPPARPAISTERPRDTGRRLVLPASVFAPGFGDSLPPDYYLG